MDISILKASRFWIMVLGVAGAVVADPAFASQKWYVSLSKFVMGVATGFVAVRTIDRHGEKSGAIDTSDTTQPQQ
jgi:hypothetical protein